ncbi:Uncharacterised protein [Bordetella pertussis]|nr:Uncharacterised protein [Bordetella pertussis]
MFRLWLGVGRGRGRVRRPGRSGHRCGLSVHRPRRAGARLRPGRGRRRRHCHLDHHSLDHSVEPGAQRAPRDRLRVGARHARAGARSAAAAGAGTRRTQPEGVGAGRRDHRHRQGRGPRRPALSPSAGRRRPRVRPHLAHLPGRLRHPGHRHRRRALGARLRYRRLRVVQGTRPGGQRHPRPGHGRRQVRRQPAAVRRPVDLGRQSQDRRSAQAGRLADAGPETVAQLHALLAPQDAGHLPRHQPMVCRHGRQAARRRPEPARKRPGRHRRHRLLPRLGPRAPACDDRQPPRLDAVAAAPMGRADGLFRAQGNRRAAPAHRRAAGANRAARRERRHRGLAIARSARTAGRRSRAVRKEPRHAGRVVRLGLDPCHGAGRQGRRAGRLARRRTGLARRPLPRRLGPAPRLVPLVAADRLHAVRPSPLQGPAHARLRGRRPGPQDEQVGRQRHRAAESVRFARRRDPAPVGRLHRLLGRAVDLRRDPQARGRKLSPHPQHAALPAGQRGRLRRGRPGRAVWRAVRNRPLRAGDDRADAGRSPGPLRTLRFPSRRLPPADVLLGRPRRVLPGHPERPPVHDGCRQRRAPFGADRVARHHPDAAQADGAHPLVHRRGSLEDPGRLGAGQAGRRPARHHLHRGLSRVAAICRRRGPDRQVDAPARHPRGGAAQAGRGAFGRRHRLVAAGRSGPVRQRGRPRHPGQPGR